MDPLRTEEPGAALADELKPLGGGGTATTYERSRRRSDSVIQRDCVKIIRPELRSDADFMRCLRREAEIGAKLRHHNIVSLLEADIANGMLVFEYIDGVNLRELLQSLATRRLSTDVAVYVAMELVEALEYAHAHGVVHRDVSTDNIMISSSGEVKLLDFGVAKLAASAEPKTRVRGKMQYMAPEHARNEPIDDRVDLFSVGVCLYEMLAGRRPAKGDSDLEVYNQHLFRIYPPLLELVPELPAELAQVITQLLEPDRDRRMASAVQCFDALAVFVPAPAIRRELAQLACDAVEYTGRGRDNGKKPRAASASGPVPVYRPRAARETKATTPPTPEAKLLLATEQPTRRGVRDFGVAQAPTLTIRPLGFKRTTLGMAAAGVVVAVLSVATVARESWARARPLRGDASTGLVDSVSPDLGSVVTTEPGGGSEGKTAELEGATGRESPDVLTLAPVATEAPRVAAATTEAPRTTDVSGANAVVKVPGVTREKRVADGILHIGVAPPSNVWIGRRRVGTSPVDVRLSAGTYTVGAGEARPEKTERVEVRSGDDKEVYIDLTGVAP